MSYLFIGAIEADNSSVIANCNSGKMPLLVKFTIAPLGNNCGSYG
jgi:hypothetical protein